MRSPYLIVRLVFLSLFTYMTVMVLVFAAWNIQSSTASGLQPPAHAVIQVFISCVSLLLVISALGVFGIAPTHVWVECAWSVILGNVQIGTAIGTSVSAQTLSCQPSQNWSVCASSALLLPTSWISGISTLAYFVLLIVTVIVHKADHPEIWTTTIYGVPWFGGSYDVESKGRLGSPTSKNRETWTDRIDVDDIDSFQKAYGPGKLEEPAWAKACNVKRGVDSPFGHRSRPSGSSAPASSTQSPTIQPAQLPIPPKVILTADKNAKPTKGRGRPPLIHSNNSSRSSLSVFPEEVENQNAPIPQPARSQWLRADVDVHTVPVLSA